jgi:tetratricopeptide (TPR) repeat protein
MAYVHGKGLLHRDLKPRNVLIAPDGTLKIADFGLAWFVEKRADQAEYGAASGTRGYKAPEQVRGDAAAIGPRTDVYGLSAILHALLTGAPPAPPADPARTARRGVPAALRGACRKGLASAPADRYQTAEELADDLRRYRRQELPAAWPTGRVRRAAVGARLWVVRNPWAFAAMLLLAALAAGAAWGTWYFNDLAGQRESARATADQQRVKAETLAGIARKAFSQSLERVGRKAPAAMSADERVPAPLLRDALAFFRAYQQEVDRDPGRRFESGQTRRWIGDVLQLLDRGDEAAAAYEDAEAVLAPLADGDAAPPTARRELAQLHNNAGILCLTRKNAAAAETRFRAATAILRGLAEQFPDEPEYRHELAMDLVNLADVFDKERRDEAGEAYVESVGLLCQLARGRPDERAYRREMAGDYEDWAKLFDGDDERGRREGLLRRALALFDELAAEDGRDLEAREDQSRVNNDLGLLLLDDDRPEEAERFLRRALDQTKRIAKDFDSVVRYDESIRTAEENLRTVARGYGEDAVACAEKGEWEEAEKAYREEIRLCKELLAEDAAPADVDGDLIDAYVGLAGVFSDQGKRGRAEQTYREAHAALQERTRKAGRSEKLTKTLRDGFVELAHDYRDEGDSLAGERRFAEAQGPYRKALAWLEETRKDFPEAESLRRELGLVRDRLGRALDSGAALLAAQGRKAEADPAVREAAALFAAAYADFDGLRDDGAPAERADAEASLGILAGRQGMCLQDLGELPAARDALTKSLGHLREALRLDGSRPAYAEYYYECADHLADVLAKQSDHRAAAEAAREWRRVRPSTPALDYLAAIVLARCIELARADAALPEEERGRLAEAYGKEAVEALRAWIGRTYDDQKVAFDPKTLDRLEQLAPLRQRADYQALVAEREKKAPGAAPPKAPDQP